MKFALSSLLAATLAVASIHATAATKSFSCKNDLVNIGDAKASALLKCGEPAVKDSFCKAAEPVAVPRAARVPAVVTVTPCETVDEWTYNPGYGQFWTTLRFESGRLTAITYGDRVK